MKSESSTLAQKIIRTYLTVIVFLLPLKFGTVIGISEVALFPASWAELLLATWPPFFFPVLSGGALLLTAILLPPPETNKSIAILPGIWLLLPILVLPGLIRTTEWDHALLILSYFIGVSCLAAAVYWALPHDDRLIGILTGAIAAATLLSCISAWRQRFGGLQETYEFARRTAEQQGRQLPDAFRSRLEQKRVFGTFVYPNSLAAHLILAGPLLLLWLWRILARIEPVRVSRAIFMPVAAGLLAGALWFTGSRAALLAFGGAMPATVIFHSHFRRYRLILIFACLAVGLAVFFAASRGRTLSSLAARGDYYEAAGRMFMERPLTGVGLGEFFPHYMRLKPAGAEETRLPHNLLLNLASQAGIAGGIMAVLCLTLPLILLFVVRHSSLPHDQQVLIAVLLGLFAWCAHSLADFNLHIPGSLATVAILPMLIWKNTRKELRVKHCRVLKIVACCLAVLAIAAIWRLPGEHMYQHLYSYTQQRSVNLRRLQELTRQTSTYLPLSPYPWVLLGRQSEHRQWHALAVEAYTEAAARTPHRASFHLHIARNHVALENWQEAADALLQAWHWYPTNPRIQEMQALLASAPAAQKSGAAE